MQGPRPESLWAKAYARRICRKYGCDRVSIHVQTLLIPDPDRIMSAQGSADLLDDEDFVEPKIVMGEYACSDL